MIALRSDSDILFRKFCRKIKYCKIWPKFGLWDYCSFETKQPIENLKRYWKRKFVISVAFKFYIGRSLELWDLLLQICSVKTAHKICC